MTKTVTELSGQLNRNDGNRTDWVTSSEVPDPTPLPNIQGYNILIRPVEPDNKIGSLLLPDSFTEDVKFLTNVGQVKSMGPLCYIDANSTTSNPHGRYKAPWCKVGDYVVWGKHQGVKLLIKGVAFVLLQDELVLMTLNHPGDINPMFNGFKI